MVQSFSRFSKQYDFYRFKRNFNIKLKRENAYTMALLYFPRTYETFLQRKNMIELKTSQRRNRINV